MRREPEEKRDEARIAPFSAITELDVKTMSVVLSPSEASAYTYPATRRADTEEMRFFRYSSLPIISSEAERLTMTVAPFAAALIEGDSGTQRSSQISHPIESEDGTSASNTTFLPKIVFIPRNSISSFSSGEGVNHLVS